MLWGFEALFDLYLEGSGCNREFEYHSFHSEWVRFSIIELIHYLMLIFHYTTNLKDQK